VTDLNPQILYEDSDILAIDKPAGLIVHSDGRTKEQTVVDWFVGKYPEAKDVGEPIVINNDKLRITNDNDPIHNSKFVINNSIKRPGVVHRIDRETSGVLLLAKTKEGHEILKQQFMEREVEKVYHLFVSGLVKNDFGTINLPIGRSPSDFRKWIALTQRMFTKKSYHGEEREALTHYKVLKRIDDKGVTFVEVKPKTGRTHQIRVHFKALNHPVLCDKLYSGRKSFNEDVCPLGFTRLALHARSITFKNTSGESVTVEAPYPEDFQNALENIDFKPN
jgi:23S rRNA pseudouridine1911/1915/1917 synthase